MKQHQKTKLKLTVFTLIIISGLFFLSSITADKLLAPQQRTIPNPPDDLKCEEVVINNRIHGWYVPHRAPRGSVLLCHGIRASRLIMVDRAKVLHRAGYEVLLIDLQAHGETVGKQITVGYLEKEDVKESVIYMKERQPALPVGIIGVSLGGASAILASPLPIDALVVESVYSTLERAVINRVTKRLGAPGIIPGRILLAQMSAKLGFSPRELRPLESVKNVQSPIMILSGSEDLHTTEEETRARFEQSSSPKELWIVPEAAHEDLMEFAPAEYEKRVLHFLNSAMN